MLAFTLTSVSGLMKRNNFGPICKDACCGAAVGIFFVALLLAANINDMTTLLANAANPLLPLAMLVGPLASLFAVAAAFAGTNEVLGRCAEIEH